MSKLYATIGMNHRADLGELAFFQSLNLSQAAKNSIDFLWAVVHGVKSGKFPIYSNGEEFILDQVFLAYSSTLSSDIFKLGTINLQNSHSRYKNTESVWKLQIPDDKKYVEGKLKYLIEQKDVINNADCIIDAIITHKFYFDVLKNGYRFLLK